MCTALIQAARLVGLFIAVAVAAAVLTPLTWGLAAGPLARAAHAPGADETAAPASIRSALSISPRDGQVLLRTYAIAAGAVAVALAFALPAALAWTQFRRGLLRSVAAALVAWPLLAPPSVIAYGWHLIATQPNLAGRLLSAAGWSRAEAGPIVVAFLHGAWLWPLPALALAASYRRVGRPVMRQALLDAGPLRGFLRAALPAMMPHLLAALAAVFWLSATDGAVAPLVGVPVWTSEMLIASVDATHYARPAAYLLLRCWPMLLVSLTTAALAGRAWSRWDANSPQDDATGDAAPAAGVGAIAALLATGLVSLLPLIAFGLEFGGSVGALWRSLCTGWNLYAVERNASLVAAGVAGVAGFLLSLTVAADPPLFGAGRRARSWLTAAYVAMAVLPSPALGRALIAAFDRPWIAEARHLSLYDDTPLVWVAGLLARFGFLPLVLVLAARATQDEDATRQAESDGAAPAQVLAFVRLPELFRPLAAGAVLLAALALSELQLGTLLAPVRFGGSLAVAIDQQIHYGRNAVVAASCLMLIVPAMAAAALLPSLLRARRRRSERPASFKSPSRPA